MIDVKRVITNAKVQLIRVSPFLGHIIMQLPVVYTSDKSLPTMAVGKSKKEDIQTKLYINEDYIENLFKNNKDDNKCFDHIIEVLRHEIYHIIFRHLTLDLPDKQRQNIACECSVNSYITRNKLINENGNAAGVFPVDFGFENKLGVHEYYRLLENNDKYKESFGKAYLNIGIEGVDQKGDKNSSLDNVNSQSTLDVHDLWEIVKEDPIAEEMLKDIIRKSVENCKKSGKWGDVPKELREEVENVFEHKKSVIPWQIILKNFLASSSENVLDYTIRKRSKRFGTRPGIKKEDVLNLAIGIDTSGSINNEMINMFFNELYWMSRGNSEITIFEIDTEIHREYDFRDWDGTVMGRGGTDLEPLLKEVSDRKFDALIFFTDMETSTFKERYNIPCLWVINNSYYKRVSELPYQEGIFLKLSNDGNSFELFEK